MEATPMKLVGVISTAVLSLALGVAAPAYAQQEQQEQQDKNTKQEEKNVQQQDKNTKQEQKSAQQQDRNNQQEQKNAQQPHTQPAQHASGNRIPDDRYKANFGREHSFRVNQSDYSRDRRFQYGGYWFGFVDPWPT